MTRDKHKKFKELASHRVNLALDAMRKIENLKSPNYKWEKEDVNKIIRALHKGVNDLKFHFRQPGEKEFKF